MALDENNQQRSADFTRAEKVKQHRHTTGTPWLIRDDGEIFPNTPLLFKRKNMRPYHGDINAPLDERKRIVAGMPGRRSVTFDELEPFNITKASKEDLIAFAMEDYQTAIEPTEHINKIRATVCKLAGLDYNEVFGGGKQRVELGLAGAGA